jgi:hypothetical protein
VRTFLGRVVAISLATCCGAAVAVAEDVPFAEYRYSRDLGLVQVAMGYMDRGSDLESRKSALEKHGILVLETDTSRAFSRTERVGVHRVETRLSMEPPVGHGEGGASSEVRLKVVMDGKTRVDCSLRYLDRISIDPTRGFITLNGHDGIVRFDGFESRKLVDDDWLADRAQSTKQLILDGFKATR